MCDVTEVKIAHKYKLVPPDGGWGYLIWVSVIITNTTIQSLMPCFGMIFNDFMIELNMGSTSVALLNGINGVFVAVSGYTTGPLAKVFSWRQLCILGSLLMNVGCVGTYFAKSQLSFFTFQAIQCAGSGYLFNISCTQINNYFLKKRLLSMSLTQTIPALVIIVVPMFFKWTLEEYGFRGTLMLIIGITMQNFIAAVLLQPVEWHMKKVPITDDGEEESLLFVKSSAKEKNKNHAVVVKIVMKDTEITAKESVKKNKSSKKEQVYNFESSEAIEKSKGVMQTISDALDLSLFKSIVVVSATLGTSLALFAEATFGMMLPQALYFVHWNETAVAWALTLMSIGDVAAKLLLIVFNNYLIKLGYRVLFMVGLAIAIVTRIGMLWSRQQLATLIFLTVMGAARCLVGTLMPLVLSEAVPQDKYANVMGMFMLLFGVTSLTVGPLIGAIRDMTNSYATSFCILTSLYAIVFMFWSIEMCYMRNRKKEEQQKLKPKRNVKSK